MSARWPEEAVSSENNIVNTTRYFIIMNSPGAGAGQGVLRTRGIYEACTQDRRTVNAVRLRCSLASDSDVSQGWVHGSAAELEPVR